MEIPCSISREEMLILSRSRNSLFTFDLDQASFTKPRSAPDEFSFEGFRPFLDGFIDCSLELGGSHLSNVVGVRSLNSSAGDSAVNQNG
jgi:hypothetical protein